MELNDAILHIVGIRDFDEYKSAMKKLLPAYKVVSDRAKENKLISPENGICHNADVYLRSTKLKEDTTNPYKITKIMAYLWPETHNRDIIYPIAGREEKRSDIWTVNRDQRLKFLDFIIETLEKIE